ncbi:class I SAM-dependent methyltransferase [Saliphagus sp. LR7]|uniref:class I SAM-dependent methyltransferase n=1 Tax=Saliphagus sp. LR7 TaxID=2282654 RepID=UPI000DF80FEC|nr:class I SAM-dependent methyltransferase [Saliphagus sp. LR7]
MVPTTVSTALADRPVAGTVCLEAGAGTGNTTAGLLAAGADRVYALTDDPEHARLVADRFADAGDRLASVEADLRECPLADDSVELITAHALCNLLEPVALEAVAAELTRVAAPGAHLLVDDYAPPPEDAAVGRLFAVENAAASLATGRPALTFYPSSVLRAAFSAHGWTVDRELTLLDPVPWTASHIEAHAEAVRSAAASLSPTSREALLAELEGVLDDIEPESVGEMYGLAMRY